MDIKSKIILSTPIADEDGLGSLTAFDLDGFKVWKDHLQVSVHPSRVGVVRIYPAGSLDGEGVPMVSARGRVVLNATQTTKLSNFIQAIQDVVKINLETQWPT